MGCRSGSYVCEGQQGNSSAEYSVDYGILIDVQYW